MNADAAGHAGHLMNPFGWAVHLITAAVRANPRLASGILSLDRARMHLIALTLAHRHDTEPEELEALLGAPIRDALHRAIGHSPVGAKRILSKLPPTVLSREGYRSLIALLDDPNCAALLQHLCETELTDTTIRVLHDLPLALRPMLARLIPNVKRLDQLPEGLRHLVTLGAAPTFDALVDDLAAQKQPRQFIGRLRTLVANLPLPRDLPPARIGGAKRVDHTSDLLALGKSFRNCLADLVSEVDAGTCAIYFWDDPASPVLSKIVRNGRFGWTHQSSLGPRNAVLASDHLARIIGNFAEAGIPEFEATRAIERIIRAPVMSRDELRRHQQFERERIRQLAAAFEDVE